MEVNVFGMYYVTHAALPHLRESTGNLVFVGSSAGKLPRPGAPVYAGSKWWTRGFALSVEAHVGLDGVGVTLVNPTAVRTQMWRDELRPGEAAEPEEVAAVIAFAAEQEKHSTLSEVDLFRRDMLGTFVPRDLDLDLSFDLD
jgi:NADP-dependent 3-hydroxy acid dehydrogenase YdfG